MSLFIILSFHSVCFNSEQIMYICECVYLYIYGCKQSLLLLMIKSSYPEPVVRCYTEVLILNYANIKYVGRICI